jgi:hypothetical protein
MMWFCQKLKRPETCKFQDVYDIPLSIFWIKSIKQARFQDKPEFA